MTPDGEAEISTDRWSRPTAWLAVGMSLVVVIAVAIRLRYSVSLNDESFYAVMAQGFAAGGKPFIDDYAAHQMVAWMESPFVWAYQTIAGGPTGLIFALRIAWLALSVGVAGLAFTFLRKVIDWRIALVASAMPLAVVPLVIMTVSYDTLPAQFIAAGVAFAGLSVVDSRERWAAAASGACFALAAIGYPTLFVVAAIALGTFRFASSVPRATRLFALGMAGALVAMAITLLPYVSGLHNVIDWVRYVPIFAGGGDKVFGIVRNAFNILVLQPAIWLALAALVYRLVRKRLAPWPLIAAIVVFSAWPMRQIGVYGPGQTAVVLVICALAVGWRAPSEGAGAVATWGLWLGFAAACMTSYASTNGFTRAGFAASSVSWLALAVLLDGVARGLSTAENPAPAWRRTLAVALAAAIAVGGLYVLATTSYWDQPPAQLTSTVSAGPYAGLRTTPSRAGFLEGLQRDLTSLGAQHLVIFAYDDFPAAYLVGGWSASPQPWLTKVDARTPNAVHMITSYMENGHMPDIVVRRVLPDITRYGPDHGYDRWVTSRYRPVIVTPDYIVMRPKL